MVVKSDGARGAIVKVSALLIAFRLHCSGSVVLYVGGQQFAFEGETISYIMMAIEILSCTRHYCFKREIQKYAAGLFLAIIQTPIMVWFELTHGHEIVVGYNLYVDGLSIIMALIIGIIGNIITVYALGYMKDFQHHNPEQKDRRPWLLLHYVRVPCRNVRFGHLEQSGLMYFFGKLRA